MGLRPRSVNLQIPIPDDVQISAAEVEATARAALEAKIRARQDGRKPEAQAYSEASPLTDYGNGERLVRQHGGDIRYCYERRRWLVWTGKVWSWDSGDRIVSLAKQTVRSIYVQAANELDENYRKEVASFAKRSESQARIEAMIALAQSEPGIPVNVNELDSNHWLFNCLNGTLDLKTGELLPHRKEDLLTVLIPINYDPNAACPLWLTFLDRITNGDKELQGYLQQAVGCSLTGDTKSQVLFFLYGTGNNGKSTFITTIRKLVGEYGEKVNTDLFMVRDKNTGGPNEALANLKGKRLVVASELEEGRKLAVSLIKDMTGGETIKADRKYEHEIEYQPTHKLWLVGNHQPVITDTTLSIWRRVKLIPFRVTIPLDEIDPDLPSKLEGEFPGILAWAVKGCLSWLSGGLGEPKAVTDATGAYRQGQDILGDFLEDVCVLGDSFWIPKAELKESYQQWCQENGTEPVSQRTFKARLIEKGILDGKSGAIRLWKGVTLQSLVPTGTFSVPVSDSIGTTLHDSPGNPLMRKNPKKFLENGAEMSQPNLKSCPTATKCPYCGGTDLADPFSDGQLVCSACHKFLGRLGK